MAVSIKLSRTLLQTLLQNYENIVANTKILCHQTSYRSKSIQHNK